MADGTQAVNYDALAQKHGGAVAASADYDALAKKFGGESQPSVRPMSSKPGKALVPVMGGVGLMEVDVPEGEEATTEKAAAKGYETGGKIGATMVASTPILGMGAEAIAARSLAPLAPLARAYLGAKAGEYVGGDVGGVLGNREAGSAIGGFAGGLFGGLGGKVVNPKAALLRSIWGSGALPEAEAAEGAVATSETAPAATVEPSKPPFRPTLGTPKAPPNAAGQVTAIGNVENPMILGSRGRGGIRTTPFGLLPEPAAPLPPPNAAGEVTPIGSVSDSSILGARGRGGIRVPPVKGLLPAPGETTAVPERPPIGTAPQQAILGNPNYQPKPSLDEVINQATGVRPLQPNVPIREQLTSMPAPEIEADPIKVKYPDPVVRQVVRANGEEIVQAAAGKPETLQAIHKLTRVDLRQALINAGEDMNQITVSNSKFAGQGSIGRQEAFSRLLKRGYSPEQIVDLAKMPPPAPILGGAPKGILGNPDYVYRAHDSGNPEIDLDSLAHATASPEEAARYAAARQAMQEVPQKVSPINLNRFKPEEIEVREGPNGAKWYKFKRQLRPDDYGE